MYNETRGLVNSTVSGITMKYISIQVQPDMDPTADKDVLISVLVSAGYEPEIDEGEDNGRYINFNVKSANVIDTWHKLKTVLTELPFFSSASIVVCEGNNGWDDYLLLHHYDKSEKLDDI